MRPKRSTNPGERERAGAPRNEREGDCAGAAGDRIGSPKSRPHNLGVEGYRIRPRASGWRAAKGMEIAGRGRGDTDGKQGRKREQPLATEERPNDQTKHLSTAVSLAGIERPPNSL